MAKGKFIVLEGMDGSGKTLQVSMLKDLFKNTILTMEPTKSVIGEEIRRLMSLEQSEELLLKLGELFAEDRYCHINGMILPLIEDGYNVITDRYLHSSLAYQTYNIPKKQILEFHKKITKWPKPDLVIYLDLSVEECLKRRNLSGRDKEVFEESDILRHAKNAYEDAIAEDVKNNIKVLRIDATENFEIIHKQIVKELLYLLNKERI